MAIDTIDAHAQTNARRAAIVAALKEQGLGGVSGEVLAQHLAISRAAVAKHIAALRELGYEIDSAPGSGYVLQSAPDLPLPFEVAPLLHEEACSLHGGGTTGSTNEDAKELAHAGCSEGTTVLAAKQVAGKGRLGRTWQSPEGGLYLSMVLRPQVAPQELAPLGLVVALGIYEGLQQLGFEGLSLKWPNDVFLGSHKLCGILIETAICAENVDYVVAGIGTNVRRGEGAIEKASYLEDVKPIRLAQVAAAEIDGIIKAYTRFKDAHMSFAPFQSSYNHALHLIGQEVCVRRIDGSVVQEGVAEGVDAFGNLLVSGTPVIAGEVTLKDMAQ